jgi:class 3 adenylate cyclase
MGEIMATDIDEKLLEKMLTDLEKARSWTPRTIAKLESLIHSEDEFALFRINPIRFADEKNVHEAEAIDLFLHATRVGLFQMDWQLLCPLCGAIANSFNSLHDVHSDYFCTLCQRSAEASMDDYMEVSFTIAPPVRKLVYHRPESIHEHLSVDDFYFKYFFSQNGLTTTGGKVNDELKASAEIRSYLEPGETKTFDLDLPAGRLWGLDGLHQAHLSLPVGGAPAETKQHLSIRLAEGDFQADTASLFPGKISLEFENRTSRKAALFFMGLSEDYLRKPLTSIQFAPFLSAKRLVTTQTFRDLFRNEYVHGAESIKIKEMTFLFTDLKGSTALYDRIGDLKAFTLVQEHFETLTKVIQNHSGAIVKTIGDAVMASFANPFDAVRAALELLEEISRFNRMRGSEDVILKIGIHRGPCIAVTLNDCLDYFGQTINIASRVQGLADSKEVYVSEEIYHAPGVQEFLEKFEIMRGKAHLRGIQTEMQVYRILNSDRVSADGRASVQTPV